MPSQGSSRPRKRTPGAGSHNAMFWKPAAPGEAAVTRAPTAPAPPYARIAPPGWNIAAAADLPPSPRSGGCAPLRHGPQGPGAFALQRRARPPRVRAPAKQGGGFPPPSSRRAYKRGRKTAVCGRTFFHRPPCGWPPRGLPPDARSARIPIFTPTISNISRIPTRSASASHYTGHHAYEPQPDALFYAYVHDYTHHAHETRQPARVAFALQSSQAPCIPIGPRVSFLS